MLVRCDECGSTEVYKTGRVWRKIPRDGRRKDVQQYRCRSCGKVFRIYPNDVAEENNAKSE